MRASRGLLSLLLAAALVGCGRQPRHFVILPDVSGSIDRAAVQQAFRAIDDLVSRLERGDRITIIPILGDAEADVSGHILRFEVPSNRQAYDADLRAFKAKVAASLRHLQSEAIADPGAKTDLLGSIALAGQEFDTDPAATRPTVVILSDFIQQDSVLDFETDSRLSNPLVAKRFASKGTNRSLTALKGVPIYLGLLRSGQYARLPQRRRDGIEEFWIEYLKAVGARPRFVMDGPGLLEGVLN